MEGVTLLIAPPGSWKSTTMRAEAVKYVTDIPTRPWRSSCRGIGSARSSSWRCAEHPDAAFAAVWRWPAARGSRVHRPAKSWRGEADVLARHEDAEKLEMHLISVSESVQRARQEQDQVPLLLGALRRASGSGTKAEYPGSAPIS